MYQFVMTIHVLAAAVIIGLVLLQQGKGATIGAAFGSGASQTVFGSRGSGSFLLRVTILFVVIFFSTSIALNYMATKAIKEPQLITLPEPEKPKGAAPVTPSSIPTTTPAPLQPVEKGKQ